MEYNIYKLVFVVKKKAKTIPTTIISILFEITH